MEEQVHNQHHYHYRHLHGTGYDGYKESGKASKFSLSRYFKRWWVSQKADYNNIKNQGIPEICLRIILPMAVVMLLFRIAILLTTIYYPTVTGFIAFIRNFAYIIGWFILFYFFYAYYHFDEINKIYLQVKNMKNVSLIVTLTCIFKIIATISKLLFSTPSNPVSITYIVGELIVWCGMFFFFYCYWKKMSKETKKMRKEDHTVKM